MTTNKVEPNSIIKDYLDYVSQYLLASESLPEQGALMPNQQLRGQLLELTLKTYICASGEVVTGHCLDKLLNKAIEHGLIIEDEDKEKVIKNTNKLYYESDKHSHRYLSRYPMPDRGTMIHLTPSHKMVSDTVKKIMEQAKQKLALASNQTDN